MKENIRTIVLDCLSLTVIGLFLLSEICEGQTIKWKGTIEIENGVRIIKNPNEPVYGDAVFNLEEELCIGSEDDKNYAFYKGVGILVDQEENIYALDYASQNIQKYDRKGKHLLTIGRPGQGPGELQNLSGACLDSQSNLYVSQARSISVFDNNGKFIRSIRVFNQIGPFGITLEKNIVTSSLAYGNDGATSDILLIGPDGKVQKRIASFPIRKLTATGSIPVGASNPFAPVLFFRPRNERQGVYGFSAEYRLFVINSMGQVVSIIEKRESPQPLTKNEKKRAIEREREFLKSRRFNVSRAEIEKVYEFPAYRPFYSGMIIDDRGNIYLMRINEGPDGQRELRYDFFSEEGYYLYRVVMNKKLFPQVIANNCVYAALENEEKGYFEIKKYRIKNWK